MKFLSAFTYCEDEVPSGLDIVKTKYGGPFTTAQMSKFSMEYYGSCYLKATIISGYLI